MFRRISQSGEVNIYIERIEAGGRVLLNQQRKIPNDLNVLPQVSLNEVFGRDSDLMELEKLSKNHDKIVLVNGIGGIGKTTLAKAFLKKNRTQYNHVAWIDLQKGIEESLCYDIQLLDSLCIRAEIEELSESNQLAKGFEIIINRLNQLAGNNLLVLDNLNLVNDTTNKVYDLNLGPNWTTLSTSRNVVDGFNSFTLDQLDRESALKFFKAYYRRETDDDKVYSILERIEFHTLLIEILAKSSQKYRLTLNEIISRLDRGIEIVKNTSVPTDHSKKKAIRINEYFRSIFDIQMLDVNEVKILTYFLVVPTVFIKYETLVYILDIKEHEKDDFNRSLNNIVEVGLIMEKEDLFKIHQIVQEVLLGKLRPNTLRCKRLIDRYLNIFKPSNPYSDLKNSYLLSFATSLIDKISKKDEQIASLCAGVGIVFELLGRFDLLLKYDLILVEIRKKYFPITSPEVANAYNNLGLTFVHLKKFRQAIYFQKKALKIRNEILSPNHPYIGRSYNNLCFTYERKYEYRNAIEYGLRAETLFKRSLKEEDYQILDKSTLELNLAQVFNNLGFNFQKTGKITKAIEYQLQSIKLREDNLPEDSPYLAESYYNTASAFMETNDCINAIKYIEKCHSIRSQTLKPDHFQLQKTINLLDQIHERCIGLPTTIAKNP